MFSFIDLNTVYLIAHLIGVALGAGGAFMSDAMFFKSFRDFTLTSTEISFLKLGSRMVWVGLALLVISGTLLVSTNPEFYFASSKFLAKITIVGLIAINGALFHFLHMPRLVRHTDRSFARDESFWQGSRTLFVSGGLSGISWVCVIILGALKTVPFSYIEIILFYLGLLIASILGALILRRFLRAQAYSTRIS